MTWLVKRKRYDGSESVTSSHATESEAEARALTMNAGYQSDNYYAEAWDGAKAALWPGKTAS